MEFYNKKDLKNLHEQLGTIIDSIDTTNPMELISLATSMNEISILVFKQVSGKLIQKSYSKEEFQELQNKIRGKIECP